jgi:hypothetical protein
LALPAQSVVLLKENVVDSLYRLVGCGVVVALLLSLAGCPSGGPATVPVEGTLKIDGQPANNIGIDFVPVAQGGTTSSGTVENGKFTLFAGVQGTPGAVVGKYKVVLRDMSSGGGAEMYGAEGSGGSSKPKVQKPPFPAKYSDPRTSDKEVEVTAGGGPITIEITSDAPADSTSDPE